MHDWELVTTGRGAAEVRRSPDGRRFVKTASTPSARAELADERDRLVWLGTVPIGVPRVLDWEDRDGVSTLITSTLRGVPASALPPADTPVAARRLVEFLAVLHGFPVAECPFDRRLGRTVPAAAANVRAGLVDQDDFDEERRGQSSAHLLDLVEAQRQRAEVLERADLAVCHGDFCLPNVLVDPDSLAVTGILDVGRLGIADRHLDVALLTRSMSAVDLNPGYGPASAAWVARRTGADPWRIEYYRLLDEFF
ncbi:aminoglycoside 3'-phosphotransferase [Actinosynnema sp. NPDC023587]|uniref:aminoglycoside 3'-phosphotransferase n=1 Tax=Actinosynnema sp. NPDC023587 TaxID=3154695 RepID=UPI0033F9CBF3